MMIPSQYSYSEMMTLNSQQLKPRLVELRELIESLIAQKLDSLPDENGVKNIGAQDNKYVLQQAKRQSFCEQCEHIIDSLNKLGHRLVQVDYDMDSDFEASSISWSTTLSNNPNGLTLVFYPNRTELSWSIGSYA